MSSYNFNNRYSRSSRSSRNEFVPQKGKYSGVKTGIAFNKKFKQDFRWINGFYIGKKTGLLKISAFENSKSKRYTDKSGKGNKFVMLMFEVFYQNTGNKVLELASFHEQSQTVVLQKLGLFIDCKKGRITKLIGKNK